MSAIGIDLGGTNIKGVVLDEEGRALHWYQAATEAEKGPLYVLEKVKKAITELAGKVPDSRRVLQGVGIGLPGQVDPRRGIALFLPNLPGWREIPVRSYLEKELKHQIKIENDVRMAAWGEKLRGAGRGVENFICIAIGTGVGSGVFVQGRLLSGQNGGAGEIGHITVENNGRLCSCGNKGCLEMYVSGRAIARKAAEMLAAGRKSVIAELIAGDTKKIAASVVQKAAAQGDRLALELISHVAEYLGSGLITVANLFNPQRIALGGGVLGLGELLLAPVREAVAQRAMPLNREVEIVYAELGEKAGALGAAEAMRHNLLE